MTNTKDNVDGKCYADYVVSELAQFYAEHRIEI
jgi:hypothetical protein